MFLPPVQQEKRAVRIRSSSWSLSVGFHVSLIRTSGREQEYTSLLSLPLFVSRYPILSPVFLSDNHRHHDSLLVSLVLSFFLPIHKIQPVVVFILMFHPSWHKHSQLSPLLMIINIRRRYESCKCCAKERFDGREGEREIEKKSCVSRIRLTPKLMKRGEERKERRHKLWLIEKCFNLIIERMRRGEWLDWVSWCNTTFNYPEQHHQHHQLLILFWPEFQVLL